MCDTAAACRNRRLWTATTAPPTASKALTPPRAAITPVFRCDEGISGGPSVSSGMTTGGNVTGAKNVGDPEGASDGINDGTSLGKSLSNSSSAAASARDAEAVRLLLLLFSLPFPFILIFIDMLEDPFSDLLDIEDLLDFPLLIPILFDEDFPFLDFIILFFRDPFPPLLFMLLIMDIDLLDELPSSLDVCRRRPCRR